MVAQGGAGVLAAEQAAALQLRNHVVDEGRQARSGSAGGMRLESVRGAGGEPLFDIVGDLLRSARMRRCPRPELEP